MASLGSFLVGISALLPIITGRLSNRSLRSFCYVTSIHGFLQGVLLFYVPISSLTYGAEWYVARLAQILFALLYAIEISHYDLKLGPELLAAVSVSIIFGISPLPKIWYGWLAFGYAFAFLMLGITVTRHSPIIGPYWIAMGSYYYAFLHLSGNPASTIWRLNWFVPSTISVVAFVLLGLFYRMRVYPSSKASAGENDL